MKMMILAAFAALSLGAAAANAQSLSHGAIHQQGNQYNFLQGGGG